MQPPRPRLLVVAEVEAYVPLAEALGQAGLGPGEPCPPFADALERALRHEWTGVVVQAGSAPGELTAAEVLERCRREDRDLPCVVVLLPGEEAPAECEVAFADRLSYLGHQVRRALDFAAARRQSARLHRAPHRRVREMLEPIALAAVVLDPAGRVQYANPFVQRLLGRGEELVGEDWFDLTRGAPDEAQEAREAYRLRFLEGAGPFHADEVLRCAEGRRRTLSWNETVLRDAFGRPSAVLGLGEEISERLALAALLQRRADAQGLLARISAGFIDRPHEQVGAAVHDALALVASFAQADRVHLYLLDEERRHLRNEAEWHRAGVESVQARQRALPVADFPWFFAQFTSRTPLVIEDVAQLPAEAESERVSLEGMGTKAVAYLPLVHRGQVSGFLGVDAARAPRPFDREELAFLEVAAGLLASALERQRIEQALRESQERIRAIVSALPDLFFRMRQDGVYLDVQARPDAPLALPPHALVGRRVDEVLPPAVARQILVHIRRALESGELQTFEYGLAVAGRPLEFEARIVVSRADEVVVIVRDVTEPRRLQRQLLQADRLASIGTLSAGVAHEVNNPLAYVIANLDIVTEGLARGTPGEAQLHEMAEALGEAREGAERVRHIVRDLKVFARGDEERVGPVDLRRVLDAAANMAANEIRHRGRLVKQYAEGLPAVTGNEGRLCQVFLNLLINAAQALPEGRLAHNEIRVRLFPAGDGRLAAEISDTGTGIPPEVLPRIFDPYFTTKATGQGTGLGLSIVQGIVQGLGGSVRVESQPGVGTTFRVELPVAEAPALPSRPPVPAALDVPVRRARVLVVDDEPAVAQALARMLSPLAEVTVCTSGQAALEAVHQGPPVDLVFCDLLMPGVSGMDLYERLRLADPSLAERFVFMTGGAFTHRAREFLAQVPNPRIDKPFDSRHVAALVRSVVH